MIELQDISFAYPGQPELFTNFGWQVQQGDAWAVLGSSGCGKTTLLYLLAGIQFPQNGQVQIDGEVLSRPRPQTGLILQDYGLLPWATVRDNVRLGLRVRQFYGPDGRHAPKSEVAAGDLEVEQWLERLGLTRQAGQYPGRLSGGQRQRTAIARTLVLRPDLLLMDEPFSSLDAVTRADLQTLILQLQQDEGFTFVVVTHSIEEALILGQRILVLARPPHSRPLVVENPGFGQVDFQGSEAYRRLSAELRQTLEAG